MLIHCESSEYFKNAGDQDTEPPPPRYGKKTSKIQINIYLLPTRSSVLTLLTVLLCFPKNFVPSELYLWLLLTLQNLLSKQDDCQEITANCQLSKFPVVSYFQRILQNPFS